MIIDSLTSFLTIHSKEIVDVELLYLPNIHITDENIDKLAAQIQKATNLTAINFRNCSISADAITKLITAIETRPLEAKPLASLNLYGNPELTTDLNNRISNKSTIIITENSSNLPALFTPPPEWVINEPYYEIELQQIFDSVAQKLAENPNVEKFHSARYPIFTPDGRKRKRNIKLESKTDLQSRFPFSVVIMEDKTPMIIPTYQQRPDKLQNTKAKKDVIILHGKGMRRKLGIRRDKERLIVDWGIIIMALDDSIFKVENEARFRSRQPVLFRNRNYGYDGYTSATKNGFVNTTQLVKNYHFAKFEGDEDIHDFVERIDDGIDGLNFNNEKKHLMAAMLLETICFHNFGLLHLDIKPENFIVQGNAGLAKLIDLENAIAMIPIKDKISTMTFGTRQFFPPEFSNLRCPMVPTIDYYTCGVSVLDLIFRLRQNEAIPEAILRAESLPEQEVTAELKQIILLIKGLCAPNPDTRFSVQQAFQQLVAILPDICKEVVNLKLEAIKASLQEDVTKYPSVSAYINTMLVNLPKNEDLVTNINLVFKLQMVCYYLNFLDLAGTAPAQVTQLATAIDKLMARENKPLLDCKDKYHYDLTVDNKINELHNSSKEDQASKRVRHELS